MKKEELKPTRVIKVRAGKDNMFYFTNDALGLCEVCKAQGVYNYDKLEVHHITKLREDPDGLLDDNNLICLCSYHHKQADAGEIDADYLRKLAKERR